MCLMPGGQVEQAGHLIDQGTLALRFLLCPQGLQVSLSPCHKPGDNSAVMNEEEPGATKPCVMAAHSWTEVRGIGDVWENLEG